MENRLISENVKLSENVTLTAENVKELKELIKPHKIVKTVPIFNNLKIEKFNDTSIRVTYTNSNIFVEKVIETNSSVLLNTPFLLPIPFLKGLKGIKKHDTFSISKGDYLQIIVSYKGLSQKLNTEDYEAFPRGWSNNENYDLVNLIDENELKKLSAAKLTVSNSEARPVLTNVLIRQNEIISTDSHRLYKSGSTLYHDKDILISRELIDFITATNKKGFRGWLYVNDKDIKIVGENGANYFSRHFSGNFPEISRLIPDTFKTELIIKDYELFKSTLQTIKAAANDRNTVAKIETAENGFYLRDNENNINTFIAAKYISDEPLKIAFSSSYMLDALMQLENDIIVLQFVSSLRPFLVRSENERDSISLILPVRTY